MSYLRNKHNIMLHALLPMWHLEPSVHTYFDSIINYTSTLSFTSTFKELSNYIDLLLSAVACKLVPAGDL